MSEMAEFRKCKRDAKLLSTGDWREWRLASVDDVKPILSKIRNEGILNSWDTVLLLDGCVRSRSTAVKQYRPNVEEMLLIKTKVSRGGSFPEAMYSGVELFDKGRQNAVLLSCEDKITEVLCLVLHNIVQEKQGRGERGKEYNKLTNCLQEKFHNGRTVLHYAVDQPHNPNHGNYVAELLKRDFSEDEKDFIEAADIYEFARPTEDKQYSCHST